jgi:hypothetical protein
MRVATTFDLGISSSKLLFELEGSREAIARTESSGNNDAARKPEDFDE